MNRLQKEAIGQAVADKVAKDKEKTLGQHD